MVERTEGKWDSASNWREIYCFDFKNSQVGYKLAKDGKMFSNKMVSLLDKLFGNKPVDYCDPEKDGWSPHLDEKELSRVEVYREGYDKRLPYEYHVITRSTYSSGKVYGVTFGCGEASSVMPIYVRLKEVPINSKVIQDAIIDGDINYPDDLESIGVEIGEFVYIDDPKQHHINNENVTIYHYKDNTFLSIGQYGGGICVLIKGKYSLEDIKKWYRWSYENADKLETVGHSVVRLNG